MSEPIQYHKKRGKRKFFREITLSLVIIIIIIVGFVLYQKEVSPMMPAPATTPQSPISISTSTVLSVTPTTPPQASIPPPSTTISQVPLNYNFGISFGDTLPGMSEDQLDATLDDLASLHIGWIRIDMAWDDVEPNNSSTFRWAHLDRVIAAANARNIKVLPILDYTPLWARPSDCTWSDKCAPADPTQFAAFVRTAVTRYAPQGITTWEVWNEPNNVSFWEPAANVQNYTALLEDSYIAIKSIEPSSTVISAGLSGAVTGNGNIAPVSFLSQLYADGAEPYFDAVGDHPYSFPIYPSTFETWNPWSQMAQTDPNLRSIMAANGDTDKKIWITEYGAPTGGPDAVSEASQAEMFSDAITSIEKVSWAGPLFFYTYKDLGTSTNTIENFFGILRYDGSQKPAYTTLEELL